MEKEQKTQQFATFSLICKMVRMHEAYVMTLNISRAYYSLVKHTMHEIPHEHVIKGSFFLIAVPYLSSLVMI